MIVFNIFQFYERTTTLKLNMMNKYSSKRGGGQTLRFLFKLVESGGGGGGGTAAPRHWAGEGK